MAQNDEQKIALEKYRNILGYLQYENTIFWTRSSFIIVAQASILGFSFRLFPIEGNPTWTQLFIILFVGVIGIVLCIIWAKMNKSSIFWINRWITLLKRIEPDAYGEIEVFRGIDDISSEKAKVHSLRRASDYVRNIFLITWILFIGYSIIFGVIKYTNLVESKSNLKQEQIKKFHL
jgi:hypothetical protein